MDINNVYLVFNDADKEYKFEGVFTTEKDALIYAGLKNKNEEGERYIVEEYPIYTAKAFGKDCIIPEHHQLIMAKQVNFSTDRIGDPSYKDFLIEYNKHQQSFPLIVNADFRYRVVLSSILKDGAAFIIQVPSDISEEDLNALLLEFKGRR